MSVSSPIVLFCDFGLPYTGQMKGRLAQELGGEAAMHPVIDLFHDVPAQNIQAGSVLLAAHAADFPKGSVFVCVVDPGVGTDFRRPGAVKAGGRWFVGPLNGLFEHVQRRWNAEVFEISWRPERLSSTFHGRDLFAPVAARIAMGQEAGILSPLNGEGARRKDFDDDVARVVYIDNFGNLVTGIRWNSLKESQTLEVNGAPLVRANTFAEVESGQMFIYENAVGLLEIAANGKNAHKLSGICINDAVKIIKV